MTAHSHKEDTMRILLVLILSCLWVGEASAKVLKIPKGSMDVNQLHDELLAKFPAWRGTQLPDGTFTDPPLRVEYTDQEIMLMVPDNADETAMQAVIKAHTPKARKDVKALRKSAKKKLKDVGLTQDEIDAILSD